MVNVTEPVKDFHKRVPDMAHKVRYWIVRKTINANAGVYFNRRLIFFVSWKVFFTAIVLWR